MQLTLGSAHRCGADAWALKKLKPAQLSTVQQALDKTSCKAAHVAREQLLLQVQSSHLHYYVACMQPNLARSVIAFAVMQEGSFSSSCGGAELACQASTGLSCTGPTSLG